MILSHARLLLLLRPKGGTATHTLHDNCKRFIHHQNLEMSVKRQRRLPLVRLALATGALGFVFYDGAGHHFTYCGALLRFFRSLKTATLIGIDYMLLESKKNEPDYKALQKAVHQKSADRLLETCLLNGGLYIKVGQGFAAINHILPKEYTKTLAKLQDQCLPNSQADVRKLFLKDFGQLPEQIYAEFDYEPVAAASLAQVFKAKLNNGKNVAVKVQYIDLQKRFISDLGTIIFLQDIVEFFFKNYNFGWILNDLRKNLVHELNFVNEARNSERCAREMCKFNFVHVPEVHWKYTKTRVLTIEWIDGFKISDIEKIKAHKFNIHDIDKKLFTIFAEQIFKTGFVHADPHPGNVFLRPNAKSGKPDIILLDHGLYEEIPHSVREPLCAFWEATVLRDEKKMASAACRLGIRDHIKFAEVLFQQPIRIHGGRIISKLTEKDIQYMQMVASQNFDLIMGTLREMPRNMLFIVRNLNTVRAIGRHHGDVVDRPRVMARYAQRCLFSGIHRSPIQYLQFLCHRIHFEYCLWSASFKLQCINWYFNFLYFLGRAPESAKHIIRDLTDQS